MAEYTKEEVAELRKRTGAGILDCRQALEENGGDIEKAAAKWLVEKGKISAGKRAARDRAQGAVTVVIDGARRRAIVALECETDFVAKSAEFVQLVDELAGGVGGRRRGGARALSMSAWRNSPSPRRRTSPSAGRCVSKRRRAR